MPTLPPTYAPPQIPQRLAFLVIFYPYHTVLFAALFEYTAACREHSRVHPRTCDKAPQPHKIACIS